ncbi:MAG: DUF2569 family protein [Erythrobacter sp.]|nr:DUF2569 family protein [Erythrobacter sp.]
MVEGRGEPSGVGGWLALLVAGLLVLGPLLSLGMTSGELGQAEYTNPQLVGSPVWEQVKFITWIAWFTQAVLSVYAGYRLTRDFTPSAVRYAVAILWFNNIGINILSFGALALIPSLDATAAVGEMVGSLIAGVVPAGIWTAYLLRSKRVRNTYYAGSLTQPAVATARTQASVERPNEPVASEAIAASEPTDAVEPPATIELYDRRFDWLLCFALVLVPTWALYGLSAALASAPAFLLVALLKPLKARMGSLMRAGVFAAGVCLFASPLLQIVSEQHYYHDYYYSHDMSELLRFVVLPITGLGLIANSWFARPSRAHRQRSLIQGIVRWGAFPIAGALALFGNWLLHLDLFAATAADSLTAEEAAADAEANADAMATGFDLYGHEQGATDFQRYYEAQRARGETQVTPLPSLNQPSATDMQGSGDVAMPDEDRSVFRSIAREDQLRRTEAIQRRREGERRAEQARLLELAMADAEANRDAMAPDESAALSAEDAFVRPVAGEVRSPNSRGSAVNRSWLIGTWAPMNGRSSNPAIYCGTDVRYTFEQGGHYWSIADHGNFSVSADGYQIRLSQRAASEMNATIRADTPLPSTSLIVERRGDRLVIGGDTFGRCG